MGEHPLLLYFVPSTAVPGPSSPSRLRFRYPFLADSDSHPHFLTPFEQANLSQREFVSPPPLIPSGFPFSRNEQETESRGASRSFPPFHRLSVPIPFFFSPHFFAEVVGSFLVTLLKSILSVPSSSFSVSPCFRFNGRHNYGPVFPLRPLFLRTVYPPPFMDLPFLFL